MLTAYTSFSMTDSFHFDALDFASDMPEVLGCGNRPSNPTPGMLNHCKSTSHLFQCSDIDLDHYIERMLIKNVDTSCKHTKTTAQHQAVALAGQSVSTVQVAQSMPATPQPSMLNSFATMDFQSFQPGFQGYNPLLVAISLPI